ncbi:MAG: amidohydrolase, partial [Oscillospiraceae bacterium]|nr:amidohydrolase [Oscillospiraceae bacterium]
LVEGGAGHGCGHNLLGAGALAAALGVKHWLEETGRGGAVTLYGCPGEEGGAAKAFMAREGLWRGLDAALTWHPEDCNEVVTGSCNATIQTQYTFRGVASHAAGAPELGRSALDAVELMNVGVQFLREHMPSRARVHYAITDAGGRSANVVQPQAKVLYMVRGVSVAEALALQKRVDKIADGAALMTETACERKFIDGTSDTVTNRALEDVVYRNFAELGVPTYAADELAFAAALRATYTDEGGEAMNAALLPRREDAFNPGSTDVGDVSWLTPTVQCHVAAFPNGCPGHSWQNVSCGATSIGHKAALHAGKVLCASAIDLFSEPSLLASAREEFERRTAGGYVCPIPPEATPTVAD